MKRLFLIGMFLSSMNQALWAQIDYPQNHWLLGASAGATFPRVDDNYINSGDGWPNDYYTEDSVDSAALFSLFGGYIWDNNSNWFPFYSLRANYFHASPSKVEGNVMQFSLPQFENYEYQYKVRSQTLLGMAKIDIYRYKNVMPFVSVGAGATWNKVGSYEEQAFPGITPRENPDFGSKTNSAFACMFTAGLDFILTEDIWLSVEYAYSYLGHAKTSKSEVYTGENLDTKLTSNNVFLSITYYLGQNS